MTPAEKARATRDANRERAARIAAVQAETRAIVATGRCPRCARALRRNLALAGWWQCSQFGAEGFRADASMPACEWQGFTR